MKIFPLTILPLSSRKVGSTFMHASGFLAGQSLAASKELFVPVSSPELYLSPYNTYSDGHGR
jgi:hypothetical protein